MTSTSLLLVLSCFFWTSKSQTEIFPPENVALTWNDDLEVELTWTPPTQHSEENCTYEVKFDNKSKPCLEKWIFLDRINKGGWLTSVRTVCNGRKSAWVIKKVPELVTNVICQMPSSKLAQCSWKVQPDHPADLSFYYELADNSGGHEPRGGMQKCTQYPNSSAIRGRCDIQVELHDTIFMVFNGTVNNENVWNTFKKWPKYNVRHPALNWTASKNMRNFTLRWTPPEIGELSYWEFYIHYSFCGQTDIKKVSGKDTYILLRKPECETCISISGNMTISGSGWTDRSDRKCFGPEPNILVYAAIIMPLLLACLAVMIIVCCTKNKDIIFPKIPEPRDFLSDISDNNNKGIVHSHYIPAEEQDCKITLVMDPQHNKL